jgi:PAS domain S-box-containing protein
MRFVAVNEAAVAQYGYSREELLERTVVDLAVPGDEHLANFLATRKDPRPAVVRVGLRRQRRKDGSTIDVDLTSLELVFAGRPARLSLARDVTLERRGELERERLQESLRRSETMSALGSLVAGVAHEVRNPLFSISATVDALESELTSQGQHEDYTRLLRSQVSRLTTLMRDLLDYGKPFVLKPEKVRPGDVFRRALRSCGRIARDSSVSLVDVLPAELPQIEMDPNRMEQALENLVSNAIQHSAKGATVRASAGPAGNGEWLEFRVEDEGEGISPEDLPRLFEPFFSRRKGGTGLGLSLVQRIVEAHGGDVAAANRAGGGAVFTARLPARRG